MTYDYRCPDKQFTPEEKTKNELKRKFGVKSHAFLEEIHSRYFNDDGTRRDVVGDRPIINDEVDAQVYVKLENYFSELVDKLSEDGHSPLIFSEKIIYDPKLKEAGTLDLLAIDEEGTTHILDWKFLEVGKDRDDIARFKQEAFDIQLKRYKEILKNNYGIKKFGMNRAIPFLLKIERENPKDVKSPYVINGITAGTVDVSKIQDLRLIPVSEKSESTGSKEIDELLGHINALMTQVGKETTTNDKEREFKSNRLNDMRKAIRLVQGRQILSPIIDIIENTKKQGSDIISEWNLLYKDNQILRELIIKHFLTLLIK